MAFQNVNDSALMAEKALTESLTNSMREMYAKGAIEGQKEILLMTANNLMGVVKSEQCPDDLKAGFTEAAKYLQATALHQPYQLRAKAPEAKVENKASGVETQGSPEVKPVTKLRKAQPSVNPATRN